MSERRIIPPLRFSGGVPREPTQERHLPARPAEGADRIYPALADASGWPLSAGILRNAQTRGQLPEPVQVAGHGLRSDPAAAGPLRPRCGHSLFRHPDCPRCHGPRAVFRRRRGAPFRASAARGMGDQRPNRARPLRPFALRDGWRFGNPSRAGQLGALDRFFRQPLYPGLLHGRGTGLQRLPPYQGHDVQAPGPAAPHSQRHGRFCRRLSECPDRQRRPGGDDLRYVGRFTVGGRLPGVLPEIHGTHRRRSQEGKGRAAHSEHRVYQERRVVAGKDRRHRLRCGRPRLDHRHWRGPSPRG